MPEKGIKCMQSQMTTLENIRLNEKNLSGKDSAKKFLLQPNICYLVNKSLIRTANEEQWKLGWWDMLYESVLKENYAKSWLWEWVQMHSAVLF